MGCIGLTTACMTNDYEHTPPAWYRLFKSQPLYHDPASTLENDLHFFAIFLYNGSKCFFPVVWRKLEVKGYVKHCTIMVTLF